jgi:16S rRNA (cytosine967-C5)-methyltransferase
MRIQDEGSQLVARLAGAKPGERVLDLCAAPGGKTVVMAADMALPTPGSLLVASDRRPRRLALLAATVRAAKSAIPIVGLDATKPLPFGATFDRVLLDAPCSGLGTLRRDPDLKWSRRPQDLAVLATAALRMLRGAADVVRPGGSLIYATCSSEPDENLDVVRAFLASDTRFVLEPLTHTTPTLITGDGCLTTTPPEHGLDAFFAARLVRHRAA